MDWPGVCVRHPPHDRSSFYVVRVLSWIESISSNFPLHRKLYKSSPDAVARARCGKLLRTDSEIGALWKNQFRLKVGGMVCIVSLSQIDPPAPSPSRQQILAAWHLREWMCVKDLTVRAPLKSSVIGVWFIPFDRCWVHQGIRFYGVQTLTGACVFSWCCCNALLALSGLATAVHCQVRLEL